MQKRLFDLMKENNKYKITFVMTSGQQKTFNPENGKIELLNADNTISYSDLNETIILNVNHIETIIFKPIF